MTQKIFYPDYFNDVFGKYYLDVDRIDNDLTLYQRPSFLSSLFLDLALVCMLALGFKIILERNK